MMSRMYIILVWTEIAAPFSCPKAEREIVFTVISDDPPPLMVLSWTQVSISSCRWAQNQWDYL